MPDFALQPFSAADPATELTTSAAGDVSGRSNFRTSVINLDRPGDPTVFDERTRREAAELIARYPAGQGRSALLPLLHLVQSVQGQVTSDGIAFCSDILDITKAQVSAVATFYTMYKRSPTGEYLVSVCTNTLCGMLGGDDIFAALKEHLGVGNNETTSDGAITLEHAECLAACDYAPVVTVNYEFFDNQTIGSARNLVSQLQAGGRPTPTRGAPLCTFKQIERQIAGFHDELSGADALAPDAVSSGVATEIGVKLALDRGDAAPTYPLEATGSGGAGGAGSTGGRATSKDAEASGSTSGPSQNDAPLQTSASDSANAAKPGGKEAK